MPLKYSGGHYWPEMTVFSHKWPQSVPIDRKFDSNVRHCIKIFFEQFQSDVTFMTPWIITTSYEIGDFKKNKFEKFEGKLSIFYTY